ncbi:MAG: substrate-binding domain-containing protein [Gemmatimonadales bacterium]|jgi:tungstate transport system substrate-binding protein
MLHRERRHTVAAHVLVALLLLPAANTAQQAPTDPEIVLATTTSVRDAGLLHALLPPFEQRTGYGVKVIAVGSGQAMELGRRGEADVLIVHDPTGEAEFMEAGFGLVRLPLMRNEFVIVGPPADPARLRGQSATDALRALADGRHLFVSRADRSGTHAKEQALWRRAGVSPPRDGYRESGQGMSATLQIANELRAYTLTDIATFTGHRYPLDLEILVRGDSVLANPYHVIAVSSARFPWVNVVGAQALVSYLLDDSAQHVIGDFGRERFGRALFEAAVDERR